MKKRQLYSLFLTMLCLQVYADTGIGSDAHVELTFKNSTDKYSVRCYGGLVHHGDMGDMFKDMDWISIGYNDADRGRLIADSSNFHQGVIDSVTMSVDYPDDSDTYNLSWANCYVYPSVLVTCQDAQDNAQDYDITESTSANAYSYNSEQTGGPDPRIFSIPARDYDDYKAKDRYDSPVAVIEIGLSPKAGAFYNLVPLYNPGSDYHYTDGYTDMTYQYKNMDEYKGCESMGLTTASWSKPSSFDTSKINLRLVYQDLSVGSFNDKSTLTLEETTGM